MADLKLSLVAQFDDLIRNRNVLSEGIEPEFLKFVANQESCRVQWLQAESGHEGLRDRIRTLEAENTALQTKLKHARGQIDHEMKKRMSVEEERDSLRNQIVLVRELLVDKKNGNTMNDQDRERLAFLSTDFQTSQNYMSPYKNANLTTIEESASLLDASDISYDKTEEDLDEVSYLRGGRKWKRPSAPPLPEEESPPEKRHRKSGDRKSRDRKSHERRKHRRSRSATVTTTVLVENGHVEAQQEISSGRERRLSSPNRNTMKRFQSTPNVDSPRITDSDDDYGYKNSSKTPRTVQDAKILFKSSGRDSSPGMKRFGSQGSSLNRPHVFVTKTIIKPETCSVCKKRITFGKVGLKCNECRISAHPECKEKAPLPCAPSTKTPGKSKAGPVTISDYAPNESPMIPALVIHCVNEVEARGLSEVGIYRVPGSEREVKELKEKFLRGKGTPNLSHVLDIHVVCGCLKDFLRGLKEPLVTYQLWNQFVNSAEHADIEDIKGGLYQAVSELPRPNRDTIAFLILHLQRISESEDCKMPVSNLAKVFGPTVIGYSTAEPEPLQMINETRKQAMVMEGLMALSTDYWTNFINVEDDAIHPRECGTPGTPGDSRHVLTSILGPVHTPQDHDQTKEKRHWFTPKFGSKGRSTTKSGKTFFSSPVLK